VDDSANRIVHSSHPSKREPSQRNSVVPQIRFLPLIAQHSWRRSPCSSNRQKFRRRLVALNLIGYQSSSHVGRDWVMVTRLACAHIASALPPTGVRLPPIWIDQRCPKVDQAGNFQRMVHLHGAGTSERAFTNLIPHGNNLFWYQITNLRADAVLSRINKGPTEFEPNCFNVV
jgi:hypothetical protein